MRKYPSRACRRAALLALLALVNPATASGDEPGREPASWMPPLPLDAAGSVQSNPFCAPPEPSVARRDAAVKLTSGEPPLVHLKPAGSAVGLVPIGESNDAARSSTTHSSSARASETAPPAKVQTNPWAKAEPRTAATPVEASPTTLASDPKAETAAGGEASTVKEAVSFSLSDQSATGEPQQSPAEASRHDPQVASGGWQSATESQLSDSPTTVTEAPKINPGKWRAPAISATVKDAAASAEAADVADAAASRNQQAPQKPADSPEPVAAPAEPASIVSSGGKTLPEPVQSVEARDTETADQPTIVSSRPTLVQEAQPIVIAGPASPSSTTEAEETAPAQVEAADPASPRVWSGSAKVAATPASQPQPARARSASRSDASRRSASEPSRVASSSKRVKSSRASNAAALRYRPPVAIAAPPLAVERPAGDPIAALVRPTVKTVAATELDNADSGTSPQRAGVSKVFEVSSPAPSPAECPRLHLDAAQVRSLSIGGTLRRVQVANDRICQAIATGDRELKLIGVSDGVTQLSVWADPDEGGESRQQVFEVHVGGAVESAGQSLADAVRMLNQSIADAFPRAQVTVRPLRDRLVVSGHCASKASATEILRLVRKTCLIPVRDELVVR